MITTKKSTGIGNEALLKQCVYIKLSSKTNAVSFSHTVAFVISTSVFALDYDRRIPFPSIFFFVRKRTGVSDY